MVDTSAYEATFTIVDADGDGLISATELQAVMKAMGEDVTPERAETIVQTIDADGDGLISLEEFARFMASGQDGQSGQGPQG